MNDIEPVDLSPTRAELIARVRARGRQIRSRRRVSITALAALVVVAIAVPAIAIGSRSTAHPAPPATAAPRRGDFRLVLVNGEEPIGATPGPAHSINAHPVPLTCRQPSFDGKFCDVLGRTLATAADVRSVAVRYETTEGWRIVVELSQSAAQRVHDAPVGHDAVVIVGGKVVSPPIDAHGTAGSIIEVVQRGSSHAAAIALATAIFGRVSSTVPTAVRPKPGLEAHVVLPEADQAQCTQTLPEGSCEVLGRTLFTDRDLRDVAVFYRQDHASWALRLTLEPGVADTLRALRLHQIAIVVAGNLKGDVYLPQDLQGDDLLFEPYTDRAGDIFYATQILGHPPAHVEVRELTARIELPSADLVAGPTVHGELVVDNASSAPITIGPRTPGCRPRWMIVLTNAQVPPNTKFPTACIHDSWTVPVGETRYPFTMLTTYQFCTNGGSSPWNPPCLPGHRIPNLPTGTYRATLESQGVGSLIPAPIPVHVVSPP